MSDIKNVIETIDVKTIYEAPISFYKEKLDQQVLNYFKIKSKRQPNLFLGKKLPKQFCPQKFRQNCYHR